MAANGQLIFTDVDKVTFKGVGNTSNAVIDTTTGKIGVGVDSPDANLHVLGNCFVSTNFELGGTMTMGTVTVRAQHELSAITATGNTTPHTVEFQNATTGLVTTGNVSVGKDLTVTGDVEVGTANLFVDTVNSRVGVGTSTPLDTLHINGGTLFAGHIIPTTSATFDIGSAEKKVRDLYVDNNSLWVGDTTKIAFSGGKMKFKRRKVNQVPRMLVTLATTHSNELSTESEVQSDAVTFAQTIDASISTVSDLKLEHWRDYAKTFDATKSVSDVFADNDDDYEAVTASEAFMEVGSNIFTEHSLSIGKTTDPTATLDIYKEDTTAAGQTVLSSITGVFSGSDATGGNINNTGLYINLDSSATGGGTSGTNPAEEHRVWGIDVDIDVTGDSDDIKGGRFLVTSSMAANGSDQNTNIYGIEAQGQHKGSGPNTNIIGVNARSFKGSDSTGLTDKMVGVQGEYEINAGTCTDAFGVRARFDRNGGAVTNSYLFHGDHIGDTTTITNNYGLYVTGADKHYLEGNVGIGTTDPGASLEVHGPDLAGEAAGTTSLISRHVSGLDGVLNIFGVAAGNGEETIGLQTQIDNRAWASDIAAGWDTGLASRYNLLLQPYKGNVGIGTTNPECLLHLSSATGTSSIVPTKLKIHTTSAGNDWNTSNPWGLIEFDTDDTTGAGRGPVAGIGARCETANGGNTSLCFYTDGDNNDDTALGSANERMCIDHDGNVGIGTTDPPCKLTVGDDSVSVNSTGGVLGIRQKGDTLDDGITLTSSHTNSTRVFKDGNGHFTIQNTGGGTLTLENVTGNVGIGATNPQQKLEVHGNILLGQNDVDSFIHSGADVALSSDVDVLIVSDANDTGGPVSGNIIFGTGSAINMQTSRNFTYAQAYPSGRPRLEYMRILGSNGNVGIGKTDPDAKLHVNGNAIIGDKGGYATNGYTDAQLTLGGSHNAGYNNDDQVKLLISGGNNDGGSPYYIMCEDENGHDQFYVKGGNTSSGSNGVTYVRGVVGIKQTSPSYTLDVNGTIRYTSSGSSASDDRIKYNEEDISAPLALISQLKPQKYEKIMEFPNPSEGTWIPTDEEWETVKDEYKYGDEFGFIAQDIHNIPELKFLVSGEETKMEMKTVSLEEYSNLTTEERSTYTTPVYMYISTEDTISMEQYSNLTSEVQQTYTQSISGYTKEIETQTSLSLNYNGLFVVAIGAIQELKAENDAIKARLYALENA